jgi:ribosomal protein L21
MRDAGIVVVDSPAVIGEAVENALKAKHRTRKVPGQKAKAAGKSGRQRGGGKNR